MHVLGGGGTEISHFSCFQFFILFSFRLKLSRWVITGTISDGTLLVSFMFIVNASCVGCISIFLLSNFENFTLSSLGISEDQLSKFPSTMVKQGEEVLN